MSAPSPVRVNPLYLGSYMAARVQGSAATEPPDDPEVLQEETALPSSGIKGDSPVDPGPLPMAHGEPHVPTAIRERLVLALAGGALHTELVVAALNHAASESSPTVEALEAYQVQASQWIEATTRQLAHAWQGSGVGSCAVSSEAPSGGGQIPEEHRYEIARLLTRVLRDHPAAPTDIEPARMAMYLTVPETVHRSLPPDSGMRLAESRALAQVLMAVLRCDFQRDVHTVLNTAWAAITETAERQAQSLDQALDLTPDARQRAWRHLLEATGVLYAATLARVHRDSVPMIQAYQDCLNAGDSAGADRLAQAYQERRLGYTGIPHYFQKAVAPIDRWVRVALAEEATVRAAISTVSDPSSDPPSPPRNRSPAAPHRGNMP